MNDGASETDLVPQKDVKIVKTPKAQSGKSRTSRVRKSSTMADLADLKAKLSRSTEGIKTAESPTPVSSIAITDPETPSNVPAITPLAIHNGVPTTETVAESNKKASTSENEARKPAMGSKPFEQVLQEKAGQYGQQTPPATRPGGIYEPSLPINTHPTVPENSEFMPSTQPQDQFHREGLVGKTLEAVRGLIDKVTGRNS